MKRKYPNKNNILLVNITRLGDMLQATPTIAGMKMENPHCKITVLVEKQFEAICHCIPNIDEIIGLDLGMTVRSLAREQDGIVDAFDYLTEVVEQLRAKNFDYCLNMSSSAYTALLLKLVGVKNSGGWSSDEEGFRVIESEWARLFATSVFHQNRQFNSLNLVDVFRCSADVEKHPDKLLIHLDEKDSEFAKKLIAEAGFTNTGPLIALQAGASQQKRQWAPSKFIQLAKLLAEKHNARVMLTGSNKENEIVEPIVKGVNNPNVVSFCGKTSVPQLAGVLKEANILITGDTGPMHMSVAVGTPVVAMFLASAYGFETGPYSEGNIVLQPVIACGPCNPNKPCSRPDCHDQITPELVVELTMMRLAGRVDSIPAGLVDPSRVVVYRTQFDSLGFLDMVPLNDSKQDQWKPYRQAYRRLWLDEIGGLNAQSTEATSKRSLLAKAPEGVEGIQSVEEMAEAGTRLIDKLVMLVENPKAGPQELGLVNLQLGELDRAIEQKGFHYPPMGPLTRMFCFAKENLSGTEALDLASQMRGIYKDLGRRARKFSQYYQDLT